MTVVIDGGAGVTYPDGVQQTNAVTNTGGDPRYYAARAWVNFNGTGTVAIRAAANVSSITDNGTGLYTVNFTTAMPDANYAVVCSGAETTGWASSTGQFASPVTDLTTTTFRIRTLNASTTVDNALVFVAVFR